MPYLGIDTEFKRTSKEDLRLSLIQICDSEEIYIIDCLEIGNPSKDLKFLVSNNVEKIFHSCREDIEALYSWSNNKVKNIYDTQVANALLGGSFSVSYQDLVNKKLEVSLNKKETRSNWMRRPLSTSQLSYAASDVQFLIDLYIDQRKYLKESGKIDWLKEDLKFIQKKIYDPEAAVSFNKTINNKFLEREKDLVKYFNQLIQQISEKKVINSTLFLSKKSQKELLDLIFKNGLNFALDTLTDWRKDLLTEPLRLRLKGQLS